jgi:predicted RNA-binding protein with PIN domain
MSSGERYLVVDGHSVIFAWGELRSLHSKNARQARSFLERQMERLHDTSKWYVTLVFDGVQGTPEKRSGKEIAVIYSQNRATADSVIERLVGQQPKNIRQSILVVTADHHEQETVEALGAQIASPEWLSHELVSTDSNFQERLKRINESSRW